MQCLHRIEMSSQVIGNRARQHGDAILEPFAFAHNDLAARKLHILDAQAQCF